LFFILFSSGIDAVGRVKGEVKEATAEHEEQRNLRRGGNKKRTNRKRMKKVKKGYGNRNRVFKV